MGTGRDTGLGMEVSTRGHRQPSVGSDGIRGSRSATPPGAPSRKPAFTKGAPGKTARSGGVRPQPGVTDSQALRSEGLAVSEMLKCVQSARC